MSVVVAQVVHQVLPIIEVLAELRCAQIVHDLRGWVPVTYPVITGYNWLYN